MIKNWNGCITISAVYSLPKQIITREQYIIFFKSLDNYFIAAGDYNAKHTQWESRLIISKERQLFKAIEVVNL
jgi:hypothetical protein